MYELIKPNIRRLVDTNQKVFLIKSLIGALLFIGLVVLISPFFNTGLKLGVEPSDSKVEVDGKELKPPYNIKLSSGKHELVVWKKGYKKIKKEILVKKYGKTKLKAQLTEKIKALIEIPPYTNNDKPFDIRGSYNKYSEPEYTITLFGSSDKEAPEKWLKDQGVDIEKTTISFIEDGG